MVFLIVLVKGSDLFVKFSADIAKRLGISEFIIGLTLVAVGTSLPELAASCTASIQNEPGLVVGNIMGSNIANIGLIIGIAATIHYIKTKEVMLKRDGYFLLFCSFMFYVMVVALTYTSQFHPAFNAIVGRLEGVALLVIYVAYVMFLVHFRNQIKKIPHFSDYMRYLLTFRYLNTAYDLVKKEQTKQPSQAARKSERWKDYPKAALAWDGFVIMCSLVMVIGGAFAVIKSSVYMADAFDLPKTIVGFTIIAIGTSLPELSVCIAAARKGYGEIILGNVIGSNITNILLIGGIASIIRPLATDTTTVIFIGPAMVIFAIILLVFVKSGWKLERWEGIVFLVLYGGFMTFVLVYDTLLN